MKVIIYNNSGKVLHERIGQRITYNNGCIIEEYRPNQAQLNWDIKFVYKLNIGDYAEFEE